MSNIGSNTVFIVAGKGDKSFIQERYIDENGKPGRIKTFIDCEGSAQEIGDALLKKGIDSSRIILPKEDSFKSTSLSGSLPNNPAKADHPSLFSGFLGIILPNEDSTELAEKSESTEKPKSSFWESLKGFFKQGNEFYSSSEGQAFVAGQNQQWIDQMNQQNLINQQMIGM